MTSQEEEQMASSEFLISYALPALTAAVAVALTVKLLRDKIGSALARICGGRPHDAKMTVDFGMIQSSASKRTILHFSSTDVAG